MSRTRYKGKRKINEDEGEAEDEIENENIEPERQTKRRSADNDDRFPSILKQMVSAVRTLRVDTKDLTNFSEGFKAFVRRLTSHQFDQLVKRCLQLHVQLQETSDYYAEPRREATFPLWKYPSSYPKNDKNNILDDDDNGILHDETPLDWNNFVARVFPSLVTRYSEEADDDVEIAPPESPAATFFGECLKFLKFIKERRPSFSTTTPTIEVNIVGSMDVWFAEIDTIYGGWESYSTDIKKEYENRQDDNVYDLLANRILSNRVSSLPDIEDRWNDYKKANTDSTLPVTYLQSEFQGTELAKYPEDRCHFWAVQESALWISNMCMQYIVEMVVTDDIILKQLFDGYYNLDDMIREEDRDESDFDQSLPSVSARPLHARRQELIQMWSAWDTEMMLVKPSPAGVGDRGVRRTTESSSNMNTDVSYRTARFVDDTIARTDRITLGSSIPVNRWIPTPNNKSMSPLAAYLQHMINDSIIPLHVAEGMRISFSDSPVSIITLLSKIESDFTRTFQNYTRSNANEVDESIMGNITAHEMGGLSAVYRWRESLLTKFGNTLNSTLQALLSDMGAREPWRALSEEGNLEDNIRACYADGTRQQELLRIGARLHTNANMCRSARDQWGSNDARTRRIFQQSDESSRSTFQELHKMQVEGMSRFHLDLRIREGCIMIAELFDKIYGFKTIEEPQNEGSGDDADIDLDIGFTSTLKMIIQEAFSSLEEVKSCVEWELASHFFTEKKVEELKKKVSDVDAKTGKVPIKTIVSICQLYNDEEAFQALRVRFPDLLIQLFAALRHFHITLDSILLHAEVLMLKMIKDLSVFDVNEYMFDSEFEENRNEYKKKLIAFRNHVKGEVLGSDKKADLQWWSDDLIKGLKPVGIIQPQWGALYTGEPDKDYNEALHELSTLISPFYEIAIGDDAINWLKGIANRTNTRINQDFYNILTPIYMQLDNKNVTLRSKCNSLYTKGDDSLNIGAIRSTSNRDVLQFKFINQEKSTCPRPNKKKQKTPLFHRRYISPILARTAIKNANQLGVLPEKVALQNYTPILTHRQAEMYKTTKTWYNPFCSVLSNCIPAIIGLGLFGFVMATAMNRKSADQIFTSILGGKFMTLFYQPEVVTDKLHKMWSSDIAYENTLATSVKSITKELRERSPFIQEITSSYGTDLVNFKYRFDSSPVNMALNWFVSPAKLMDKTDLTNPSSVLRLAARQTILNTSIIAPQSTELMVLASATQLVLTLWDVALLSTRIAHSFFTGWGSSVVSDEMEKRINPDTQRKDGMNTIVWEKTRRYLSYINIGITSLYIVFGAISTLTWHIEEFSNQLSIVLSVLAFSAIAIRAFFRGTTRIWATLGNALLGAVITGIAIKSIATMFELGVARFFEIVSSLPSLVMGTTVTSESISSKAFRVFELHVSEAKLFELSFRYIPLFAQVVSATRIFVSPGTKELTEVQSVSALGTAFYLLSDTFS